MAVAAGILVEIILVVFLREIETIQREQFHRHFRNAELRLDTLEDALQLFALPRRVGFYEDAEIITAVGRFGPYVKHAGKFVSLAKGQDPYTITEAQAIALIEESRKKETGKVIADYPASGIQVLNGRYGPYIKKGKENFKIPKKTDPSTLTEEACQAIIAKAAKKKD